MLLCLLNAGRGGVHCKWQLIFLSDSCTNECSTVLRDKKLFQSCNHSSNCLWAAQCTRGSQACLILIERSVAVGSQCSCLNLVVLGFCHSFDVPALLSKSKELVVCDQ
jgi:hypothetical protein